MRNRNNYKRIYTGFEGAGRDVYVANKYYDTFKIIMDQYHKNYHMTSIMRQIVSLNADALQGLGLNMAGDYRQVTRGHITMHYSLFNGSVIINFLLIKQPVVDNRSGLYTVSYRDDRHRWEPEDKPVRFLDNENHWKSKEGKAHYAAVSGRFKNIGDAAQHMHEHLVGAYQKSDYLTSSDARTPFSLFWVQKGQHKSTDAAEVLASIMQQSSKADTAVNWLVHDAGVDTFKAAAKILSHQPLADAATRAQDSKAGMINKQNVYFSNPNTSAIHVLERLCQQAGLHYVGMNTSNRDLHRWSTLKNIGLEMGKSASAVALGGSLTDSALKQIGAGGIEKVFDHAAESVLSGNPYGVMASILAGGFIAVGVAKRTKLLAAGIYCTFGKGNQNWYTDDGALLG